MLTRKEKQLNKLQRRINEFPIDWQKIRFAKTNQGHDRIVEIVELYLSPKVYTLDEIARQVGLIDRRSVGAYLSKAKRKIK